MKKDTLLAVLRLQATKNVGDIIAKKLILATGSPEQIFKESISKLAKIPGIGRNIIAQLQDKETQKRAEEEYTFLQKNNYAYTYFLNEDYPKNLQECVDAPILLFYDGTIDFCNQRILSIVGTRTATNYGRNFCNELITNLASYDPIIVSGFAYGIDICAHTCAIEHNLQTIAVLANGLEEIYPKNHKKYIHQIQKKGGFMTEFWHHEKPIREYFLRRNRIVAGLSQATIVIESPEKGGSLVTADIANSYNRDVFALIGRAHDAFSKGCNTLVKTNKAHALTDPKDIIEHLNWDRSRQTMPIQTNLFTILEPEEKIIYEYLHSKGKQLLDTIALDCNIPVYKLSSLLVQMELKNVIKPLPGKFFEV